MEQVQDIHIFITTLLLNIVFEGVILSGDCKYK